MSNAWLVRPYPHNKEIKRVEDFKQNNLVAIGWPGIGDLTGKSREDIKRILAAKPYELSGLALGNAYATIDIFVNRMNSGDLVLVPDGADIFFAEISSDYFMDGKYDNEQMGYPHQRKVKWLKSVAREDLSKQLRSSLKVHRTTADLSKHYDEIKALAYGLDYQAKGTEVETVAVSYPLRKDFSVVFEIPVNITKDEAKRLARHLETLYYA